MFRQKRNMVLLLNFMYQMVGRLVNVQLERTWEDDVVAEFTCICLKELKQIPNTRNEYIQCPDQI